MRILNEATGTHHLLLVALYPQFLDPARRLCRALAARFCAALARRFSGALARGLLLLGLWSSLLAAGLLGTLLVFVFVGTEVRLILVVRVNFGPGLLDALLARGRDGGLRLERSMLAACCFNGERESGREEGRGWCEKNDGT